MKLPQPIVFSIERAIDTALSLDPETRTRLASIDGKSLQINVTNLELSLLITVLDGEVSLANVDFSESEATSDDESADSNADNSADAIISGTLNTLSTLLSGNEAVYSGKVKVEGDIGLTQHLRQIVSNIELDWQEALSPIAGDAITHRIDVAQTQLLQWLKRTRGAAKLNLREYLQEEAELLAPSFELETFCEEVDELRAAADRLAAKVQLLEQRLEKQC